MPGSKFVGELVNSEGLDQSLDMALGRGILLTFIAALKPLMASVEEAKVVLSRSAANALISARV